MWNSLPAFIRNENNLNNFKLKTYYFRELLGLLLSIPFELVNIVALVFLISTIFILFKLVNTIAIVFSTF